MDWNEFRRQMPVTDRWAYFDHAAVCPISGPAHQAIQRWAGESLHQGDTVWPDWTKGVEACRQSAATLLNASTDEIALVPNTTAAVNIVAEAFPWQPGDNVVIPDDEFPANVYPWLNLAYRGVETRRIASDVPGTVSIDRLLDACDARTRIISVSWVGYASGWRVNVNRLVERAHQRGILVFLDAIQGLGVFPLDVRATQVDFVAADGHKWLLGLEGAGLFYLCKEHIDLLRPIGVGWHSVVRSSDYAHIATDWRPTAARYEGGSQNMVGFLGLGASLNLLLSCGPAKIGERLIDYTAEAVARLSAAGAKIFSHRSERDHCSGIVSFELPGYDPLAVKRKAVEAGVAMACRAGRLRISPHAYQNEDDLRRLLETLPK